MTVSRALLPVAGLLFNAAAQTILVRSGIPLLRSVLAGFAAGLAMIMWVSGISPELAGDVAAYAGFGYCYFHFINLGETARRIRLVRELHGNPEGLSEEELLSRYSSRDIVSARVGRLLGKGQIVLRNGRYFTGRPVMRVMAGLIVFMKLAVIGKRSEFEKS